MKKLFTQFCLFFIFLFSFFHTINATYIQVYSTTDNGGISWTGNSLGLNKQTNENEPGTAGSIGAFTTVNTLLQVGTFPPGTTLDWTLNSSSAILDIPPDSTILHAELVWSGSYGFNPAITGPVLNSPVTLITPDLVSHSVVPNPATAQSRVETGSRGFYVRSADVTSLVTTGGTFTVGGVPGTVAANENASNCCGWTLEVVYRNPNSLTSNMTLFVACEQAGNAPALVTGFHAPDSGQITSRLFVCALEGDAQITGDRLLVGATLPLSYPANRVSGTNNPASNFFASQINTLLPLTTELATGKIITSGSSLLDTRGTFGNLNSLASGTSIFSARQGYDITSVDLGSQITNGQNQLYVQGTTTGDGYTITGLGIALEVLAPVIRSEKSANTTLPVNLNENIVFTFTFNNVGGDASGLVFKDILPLGLTYVPGTFTLNAVPVPAPDLVGGTPIGNLPSGATTTVEFTAQVTQINPPVIFTNAATVDYNFVPFNGQAPISLTSQTNDVILTAATLTPPVAANDSYTTVANMELNGSTVFVNDTGTDISILLNSPTTVPGSSVIMQPDGTFTYTPPTDFSGVDSFTYQLVDILGQPSNIATVTVTVLPVAIGDTGIVAGNSTLTETTSVLSNDFGTNLVITSYQVATAQGGTVVMQPNGTYVYTPPLNFSGVDVFDYTATDALGTGNSSTTQVTITVLAAATNDFGTTPANAVLNGKTVFSNDVGSGITLVSYDAVSAQGGQVVMNNVDGSYVYTPPLNFSGIDSFQYTVRDVNNNLSVATVTITVTPIAENDESTTVLNTELNGPSVLLNDVGSALTILSYDAESINGGLVVMNPATGTYNYTPPLNFTGVDTFTYTLRDGANSISTATVSITVTDAPVGIFANTIVNVPLVGPSVLTEETGTALEIFSFQNVSAQGGSVSMNADGTYSYIPPLNFSGTDSFTFVTIDGAGVQSPPILVTITVFPLAQNDTATTSQNTPLMGPSVLSNDGGSNLSIIGYQGVSAQGGTVTMNANGTYVYTPPPGYVGPDTFTYTIQDTIGNQSTGTVTIFVTAVGVPGTFVGILKKCTLLNKNVFRLTATWSADPSGSAVLYRIYSNGVVIGQVAANQPLVFVKCFSSKRVARGLQLVSVNSVGVESTPITIRITNE